MRTRTARRQLRSETPRWLLELEQRVRELGTAHQFGTMLEAIREASRMHGTPYPDLCRQVARLALDLGHVQPLPVEFPQEAPTLNG